MQDCGGNASWNGHSPRISLPLGHAPALDIRPPLDVSRTYEPNLRCFFFLFFFFKKTGVTPPFHQLYTIRYSLRQNAMLEKDPGFGIGISSRMITCTTDDEPPSEQNDPSFYGPPSHHPARSAARCLHV